MTGLTPPTGVDVRRPGVPRCVAEWRIPTPSGGWLAFRLIGPALAETNRRGDVVSPAVPARIEVCTGPASFGPELIDPAEVKRFGWTVLTSCHALAAALELALPEPPPDPQMTFDDVLETARG